MKTLPNSRRIALFAFAPPLWVWRAVARPFQIPLPMVLRFVACRWKYLAVRKSVDMQPIDQNALASKGTRPVSTDKGDGSRSSRRDLFGPKTPGSRQRADIQNP